MNWSGSESLWGAQQGAPDKSRVVMGTGSHRCNAQDDMCMWDSALGPAPSYFLYHLKPPCARLDPVSGLQKGAVPTVCMCVWGGRGITEICSVSIAFTT